MKNNDEISVLIVEDEALIAENIAAQLQDFGFLVAAVCYDYETAKQAIDHLDFDMLLTDINLGKGIDVESGIVLANNVRSTKNCPIIYLTAFGDADTVTKAMAVKPSAYLIKPANAAQLFATVQLAIANYEDKKTEADIGSSELSEYIFIKSNHKKIKLFWKDVYCLESVKNYVKISATSLVAPYLIRSSLRSLVNQMIPENISKDFVKLNRSIMMRKSVITEIGKNYVTTTHGRIETEVIVDIKL